MSEVIGQEHVKRALEVGAVGRSNILMIGPPGAGKSMLSVVYTSLIDETYVSISHGDTVKSVKALIEKSPEAVIVGDDFAELKRDVMFYVREATQGRKVLVASMHPCPCGYLGDMRHQCACSPPQVHKYRTRIPGSVYEMFDISIEVPALPAREIVPGMSKLGYTPEDTLAVMKRVRAAREIMGVVIRLPLEDTAESLLETAIKKLGLSMGAVKKAREVAEAIAALDGETKWIRAQHIAEAVQYRTLDRSI